VSIEATYSFETSIDFQRPHDVLPQKKGLIIIAVVRTTVPRREIQVSVGRKNIIGHVAFQAQLITDVCLVIASCKIAESSFGVVRIPI
jgi:hypothetical protein